jgi:hypothetical protein
MMWRVNSEKLLGDIYLVEKYWECDGWIVLCYKFPIWTYLNEKGHARVTHPIMGISSSCPIGLIVAGDNVLEQQEEIILALHTPYGGAALPCVAWYQSLCKCLVHMHSKVLPPFGKRSRLRQRHGPQNTTLTSFFYKNIYWKLYMYIFLWKWFAKQIYWYDFHISELNDLKVIYHLYS